MLPPGLIDATPRLGGADSPRRAMARLQRAAVVPWELCHADTTLVGLMAEPFYGLTSRPPVEEALAGALDRLYQAGVDEGADLRPGAPMRGVRDGAVRPLVPRTTDEYAAAGHRRASLVPGPAGGVGPAGHRATDENASARPLVPRPVAGVGPALLRATVGDAPPRPPFPRPAAGEARGAGPAAVVDRMANEPPAPRPEPWRRVPSEAAGPSFAPSPAWPALGRFAASVPGGPEAAATPIRLLGRDVDNTPRADIRDVGPFPEEVRSEVFDHRDAGSAPARGLAGLTRWWDDNSEVAAPSRPLRPLSAPDTAAPISAQSLSEAMSKLFVAEARRYGIEVAGS